MRSEDNKLSYISNWYLFIPFFGIVLPDILYLTGFYIDKSAIDYYGEVHTDHRNKMLHMLLLPCAACGYSLGVPALFKLSFNDASLMRNWFYLTFVFMYARINMSIAFVFAMLYAPPLILSHYYYRPTIATAVKGITVGSLFMFIMKYIGHTAFEHENSRLDGIVNAILYSHFYISQEWVRFFYQK